MPKPSRPRLAWFTPLRPVESGISHYNEDLLPIIASVAYVDVYVDGYRATHLAESSSLTIRPAKEFRSRQRRAPYDAIVYQMGNSPAHAYMYRLALEFPGILVLHDTVLHHLMLSMLLPRRGAGRYRTLMTHRYGEAGREAAERTLRGRMPDSLFEFPLSEELIGASRLTVVHSQASRAQVRTLCPDADVMRVPMGVPLPPELPCDEARRRLSLPLDQFVISSVTHVNPYKRIDVVLRVLARLRQSIPARLLVAGSVSPLVPLGRLVALYGLEPSVDLLGFVDDPTARLAVAAADVCVNLRWPSAGETSASLLRTMGAGRPTLITDAGSFQEIPDGAAVKIPPDALEEEMIFALLARLATDIELRNAIGRQARAFIAREHSLSAMAAGYRQVLDVALGASLPAFQVGDEYEHLDLPPLPASDEPDVVIDALANAFAELGLVGDERLLTDCARAAAEIGLMAGKIEARVGNSTKGKEPGR